MLLNEPMSRHTSWKVGGAADRLYRPADLEDLQEFMQQLAADEPVEMVGLGSNLLVRDGGIRGTVILMHQGLDGLSLEENSIRAEAGVACAKVARFAARNDRCGAEFLAGIPGTVGGALAMNAGCYGSQTWEIVSRVAAIDRSGKVTVRKPAEYEIAYRQVKGPAGEWFVAAWFDLPQGDGAASQAKIRELLQKRSDSQPLALPNAGSVFRNPEGNHAAKLIEACRLKGLTIGGAMVSLKHANFIVNHAGAKACDIEQLIETVQQKVFEQFGIRLHREVKILGEKEEK